MKKLILSITAAIILAILASAVSHDNSLDNLRFRLGMYDRSGEEKAIEETLKLFNKYFASFFNTGGVLTGLNEIPAANLVKRRIFQEIAEWTKKGRVFIYDKDIFEIEETDILNRSSAVVVAKEVWFMSVQEREKRKPVSDVKASPVRVRYIMKKIEGAWRVVEFEMFDMNDTIGKIKRENF